MRKFIRLFAIPLLILWWLFSLFQEILLAVVCILDLNPEETKELYIENLFSLIKNWIKDGVDSL